MAPSSNRQARFPSGPGLPAPLKYEVTERQRDSAGYNYICGRALALFLTHLDAGQRKQYALNGTVSVTGNLGGRYTIRLTPYTGHEVWSDDRGHGFCVYAQGYPGNAHAGYPPGDGALAILLTIRHNEAEFLSVAVPYPRPSIFVHHYDEVYRFDRY